MIFLEDQDFTLHQGDALQVLRELPAESAHMCCTSPPFFGQRDYQTGSWEGGDEGCDHLKATGGTGKSTLNCPPHHQDLTTTRRFQPYGDVCGKCGARRVDQQIGLESTPDEYVARLVEVFREVRRVLRRDGTLWLEIGDSYASSPPGNKGTPDEKYRSSGLAGATAGSRYLQTLENSVNQKRDTSRLAGIKPKDLVGAPWLLAFALRADGWYLRSDIIWARPNPMPESVRDRPTKSHSYVFLLSKQPRYFMDMEAVREPNTPGTLERYEDNPHRPDTPPRLGTIPPRHPTGEHPHHHHNGLRGGDIPLNGRNLRSVWTIPTEPLPDEHYAAYPQKLVERCILAGTSERGVCPECGAPWERVVEKQHDESNIEEFDGYREGWRKTYNTAKSDGDTRRPVSEIYAEAMSTRRVTKAWEPTCDCYDGTVSILEHAPATVLDPFLGSGTTALVARRLGRRCVGIELSPEYCRLAARRTQQLSLGVP